MIYKVRVCPVCGTENPPSASDCESCQADILGEPLDSRSNSPIATSAAAPAPPEPTGPLIILEAIQNPALKWKVGEGQSVGRSSEADVVLKDAPDVDFVSRKMAVFSRRGDQWFVQHVGTTNYITVDGDRYESDDDIAIHDGSILGLALSQFMIRIPSEGPVENG